MRGAVCYNLLIRQKAGEAMALGKEYFESLGLEIAKRKYYNAAKVESVIEDFSRRAAVLEGEKAALEKGRAALESENAALRTRAEALSCGREEIGDAILSAKVISQQLLAEAREQADAILSEARAEAERLVTEAEERARAYSASCAEREQKTMHAVQEAYLRMREECLGAVSLLDGEWQRYLCAVGEVQPETEEALPADLPDRLGELAACLAELGGDDTEKQET